MYLKSRLMHYGPVLLAMMAAFAVVSVVMEQPGFSTAIIAIATGLVIGEIFHYLGVKKERREP